jgi:L-ascorbate metabolism protein UlaG (beta-lactamase superfamily)
MLKENSTYRGAHKVNRDRVVVLRPGESVQLPHIKVDAFASTDIGNSYVVSTAQIRLFFAGDLNAWIWKDESTKKEIEAAIRDFKAILMTVREKYSEFDIAFFPVDPRLGRDFWEGAAIFSQEFKIHNLVPMHFEWGVTPEEQEYFYTSVASAPWLKDSDCNYVPLFRNDTYTL